MVKGVAMTFHAEFMFPTASPGNNLCATKLIHCHICLRFAELNIIAKKLICELHVPCLSHCSIVIMQTITMATHKRKRLSVDFLTVLEG